MDEIKKEEAQGEKPKIADGNSNVGISKKGVIDEAKEIAAELKGLIAERAKQIEREENLKAAEMLGGRSEAGLTPKAVTNEERIKAENDLFLKQAGLR